MSPGLLAGIEEREEHDLGLFHDLPRILGRRGTRVAPGGTIGGDSSVEVAGSVDEGYTTALNIPV